MWIDSLDETAARANEIAETMRDFRRKLKPVLKDLRIYTRELRKAERQQRKDLDMKAWFVFMEDMLGFLPLPAVARAFAAGGMSGRRRMVKKKAKAFMKALSRHPEHLRMYEAELIARERRLFNEQLAAARADLDSRRAELSARIEELRCKPIVSGGSDN